MWLATISADMPTRGKPPPGWEDPPTRNRFGIFVTFSGLKNADRIPLLDVP